MTILKKLLMAMFLTLFICAPNVEAKIVTDKLPLLTFAETEIAAYDSPNGTKKGTIPAENSLVLVKQIQCDGWAYGSYKPSNSKKRVYCWFKMAELQGYAEFENYTDQLTSDTSVYRTRTSGSLVGNAPSNEDVIVVAKRGDKTKILFKADGEYYRMGWVYNSGLKKNSGSNYDDGNDDYDKNSSGDSDNGNSITPTNDNENSGGILIYSGS